MKLESPRRRSRLRRLIFAFLVLGSTTLGGLVLLELAAREAFRSHLPPSYEKTRQLLAGEIAPSAAFQRAIGQAYLEYVPAPNYSNEDGARHNAQAYAGREVPLRRRHGILRVLCLGGSTTYGWGISPDDAYPAQLERRLGIGVEILNAGIPWGTTAEMLTHYQFKFRYWKPDLVILNPGGNDAQGVVSYPYYHPDYSHWRQPMPHPQPLPRRSRVLAQSRLLTLALLIPLLYDGGNPGVAAFAKMDHRPPAVPWYDRLQGSGSSQDLPLEELAFKVNTEALVRLVQADGAKVLLVAFREAPNNPYPANMLQMLEIERKILEDIGKRMGVDYAPYPADVTSPGNWIDECHTSAAGAAEKARHIEPFARKLLGIP